MKAIEVPPWRWGERFDPRVVRALLDVADAANDQALALAEAVLIEERANTTLERLAREGVEVPTRRHSAAQERGRAAGAYSDQLVRLYAAEALRFAYLTARLFVQLKAGADPSTLTVEDVSELRPSGLYADPALLPAPPVDDDEDTADVDELSLSRTYAKVLNALEIVRQHPTGRRDELDVGAVEEVTTSVWGMGGVDLAEALHQYGHLCLWRLAGGQPLPALPE